MKPNDDDTPLKHGIVQGLSFGVIWGAAMWFGVWRKDGVSVGIAWGLR